MPPKAKPKIKKIAIHLKFHIGAIDKKFAFNKTSATTKDQFKDHLETFLMEDLIDNSLFPVYPETSVAEKSMKTTMNKDGITLKAKLQFKETMDDVATITSKVNRMIQTLGLMNRDGVVDDKTQQTYYITSIQILGQAGGTKKRKNMGRRTTRRM